MATGQIPPSGEGIESAEINANLALVLDPVAEAIYESIFDDGPLGPEGTIERALYRQAAEAGLRAGMLVFAKALGERAMVDVSPNSEDRCGVCNIMSSYTDAAGVERCDMCGGLVA